MPQSISDKKEDLLNDELLKVKNWMTPSPFCIQPGQTLAEASKMMASLHLESLPVADESNRLVGMITSRKLLNYFAQGNPGDALIGSIPKSNQAAVRPDDSILDIMSLPYDQLPVTGEDGELLGILTARDILDGLSKYLYKLRQQHNSEGALGAILESAYEGIAVVDENGILQEFNEAYSRFTGIKREDAIGRHVTEVIDNTHLHETVKTGIAERGVLQNIQGHDMVVHRIPLWKEGRIAGAIGMLIFEGVTEVYKIYEKLQENQDAKPDLFTKKKENDSRVTLDQIIGTSEGITEVKRLARKAARTVATVLITGESGTGKEMFAKSIHHLSPFSTGPFISVNCGAIPEHLFESELFGYEEGAFTGAKKGGKPGKFELADNGTIFLDEIGEMPLVMQTKLLRVLQEKEAERVGGVKKYQINVRIIAATNRNLMHMVETGEFREDLYYRLNIIQLHIPPLRERKKDIPVLLVHYLKEICERYQVPGKLFTSEAVNAFVQHPWRGNIREMVNTVEQLVTLVDGKVIDYHHLPEMLKKPEPVLKKENPAAGSIEEAKLLGSQRESEIILDALRSAGGNKSRAADLLGIHRTTLYQKLKKHRIT
ncbi:Fis family transcriptional regulator [Cytobacillus firmus]|uniref:sigma 54-interacting transcriptional regulator n=1 Tax=Cytobacillus firmus TaxID=1399 RepID=UPI00077C8E2B|nr:sigma 54-interacting transcriptional regulator [Cytobacillus firmus]MBG9545487.1 Fis family transcriptional regulator [Cytobacillus firmus]MBG9551197.1 Fis family transcriptional regulator [Cytobacillus firmus]MBG9557979.1 Fis family transcriptional regulator [Cytobacillus firmus]MBG9577602.1 Fis family transcriptional regulator [Cytobacillus firmus]MEC1891630.1 sigma 54-interacting transcriptional regulator [Cytobacillus firmus]